jgi:hypothetical protein
MRWLDDVEEDLRRMRIIGCRGKARRRDEWKSVLRKVKFFKDRSAIWYRYGTGLCIRPILVKDAIARSSSDGRQIPNKVELNE